MPFQFGLATVLQVRAAVEEREERLLQRIELQIAHTKHQIQRIDTAIRDAILAREQAVRSPIPAVHLMTMLEEEQSLEAAKTAFLQRLRELSEERRRQMKHYEAAHRDHEALLNMRKEQLALYEQEQARAQQKALDDLYLARRRRG